MSSSSPAPPGCKQKRAATATNALLPTFSPAQVAESYGVCVDTITKKIADGELGAINIGAGKIKPRWRIRQSDLDAFERLRESKKPPKPSRRRRKDPSVTEYF